MRFIFNFIFFGILFFIIWQYFPETFHTLVTWASSVFAFLKDLVQSIIEKIHPASKPAPETPKALYDLGMLGLLALRNWNR